MRNEHTQSFRTKVPPLVPCRVQKKTRVKNTLRSTETLLSVFQIQPAPVLGGQENRDSRGRSCVNYLSSK
jgi:hypothetical protein